MGKRQIGEMQAFELVITLIVAEIACIPMADVSIPLLYGIVAIIALFLLHQATSLLEKLNKKCKYLINGKPSIVVTPTGVDFSELKSNNMDVEDLIEALRMKNYFSLDDVDYAIFETNGKLSILEKENYTAGSHPITFAIIKNGKADFENLYKLHKDKKWLEDILLSHDAKISEVGVMTLDKNGKIYLQKTKGNYLTFNVSMKSCQTQSAKEES
jgi:uncharacterized membrane protein YcaP (DUF421 family)